MYLTIRNSLSFFHSWNVAEAIINEYSVMIFLALSGFSSYTLAAFSSTSDLLLMNFSSSLICNFFTSADMSLYLR